METMAFRGVAKLDWCHLLFSHGKIIYMYIIHCCTVLEGILEHTCLVPHEWVCDMQVSLMSGRVQRGGGE